MVKQGGIGDRAVNNASLNEVQMHQTQQENMFDSAWSRSQFSCLLPDTRWYIYPKQHKNIIIFLYSSIFFSKILWVRLRNWVWVDHGPDPNLFGTTDVRPLNELKGDGLPERIGRNMTLSTWTGICHSAIQMPSDQSWFEFNLKLPFVCLSYQDPFFFLVPQDPSLELFTWLLQGPTTMK